MDEKYIFESEITKNGTSVALYRTDGDVIDLADAMSCAQETVWFENISVQYKNKQGEQITKDVKIEAIDDVYDKFKFPVWLFYVTYLDSKMAVRFTNPSKKSMGTVEVIPVDCDIDLVKDMIRNLNEFFEGLSEEQEDYSYEEELLKELREETAVVEAESKEEKVQSPVDIEEQKTAFVDNMLAQILAEQEEKKTDAADATPTTATISESTSELDMASQLETEEETKQEPVLIIPESLSEEELPYEAADNVAVEEKPVAESAQDKVDEDEILSQVENLIQKRKELEKAKSRSERIRKQIDASEEALASIENNEEDINQLIAKANESIAFVLNEIKEHRETGRELSRVSVEDIYIQLSKDEIDGEFSRLMGKHNMKEYSVVSHETVTIDDDDDFEFEFDINNYAIEWDSEFDEEEIVYDDNDIEDNSENFIDSKTDDATKGTAKVATDLFAALDTGSVESETVKLPETSAEIESNIDNVSKVENDVSDTVITELNSNDDNSSDDSRPTEHSNVSATTLVSKRAKNNVKAEEENLRNVETDKKDIEEKDTAPVIDHVVENDSSEINSENEEIEESRQEPIPVADTVENTIVEQETADIITNTDEYPISDVNLPVEDTSGDIEDNLNNSSADVTEAYEEERTSPAEANVEFDKDSGETNVTQSNEDAPQYDVTFNPFSSKNVSAATEEIDINTDEAYVEQVSHDEYQTGDEVAYRFDESFIDELNTVEDDVASKKIQEEINAGMITEVNKSIDLSFNEEDEDEVAKAIIPPEKPFKDIGSKVFSNETRNGYKPLNSFRQDLPNIYEESAKYGEQASLYGNDDVEQSHVRKKADPNQPYIEIDDFNEMLTSDGFETGWKMHSKAEDTVSFVDSQPNYEYADVQEVDTSGNLIILILCIVSILTITGAAFGIFGLLSFFKAKNFLAENDYETYYAKRSTAMKCGILGVAAGVILDGVIIVLLKIL